MIGALYFLQDFGVSDAVDICFTGTLFYGLLLGLRKTKATFVLGGMLFLSAFYFVALTLGLRLTSFLFQIYFTVIIVAFIVIFQEEIRSFFERIALWLVQRRNGTRTLIPTHYKDLEILVSTLAEFAKERIGALIVIQAKDNVSRHLHGGVALEGRLSEPLLKSIFDPHSMGHDGALVLVGKQVTRFACHLPLSSNADQLGNKGTRHAAALGMSEKTDALCLVVSEERGVVSVARWGQLQPLKNTVELRKKLEEFHKETLDEGASSSLFHRLFHDLHLKAVAIGLAFAMWFLFVHESVIEYRSFYVPVQTTGLSTTLELLQIEPKQVRVVVSGPRRAFYFINETKFEVILKLFGFEAGESEATVTASDINLPGGMEFVNVFPRTIVVQAVPRS